MTASARNVNIAIQWKGDYVLDQNWRLSSLEISLKNIRHKVIAIVDESCSPTSSQILKFLGVINTYTNYHEFQSEGSSNKQMVQCLSCTEKDVKTIQVTALYLQSIPHKKEKSAMPVPIAIMPSFKEGGDYYFLRVSKENNTHSASFEMIGKESNDTDKEYTPLLPHDEDSRDDSPFYEVNLSDVEINVEKATVQYNAAVASGDQEAIAKALALKKEAEDMLELRALQRPASSCIVS